MRIFLLLFFGLMIVRASAQKELIDELNGLLEPGIRFSEVKKGIQVEFISKGDVFRSEYFVSDDVDIESIRFESENQKIWLECHKSAGKCFDRKIFRTKSRQPYPMLYFEVKENEKAVRVVELLKELVEPQEDN